MNPPCRPGDILYVRETWQHGFGGTYLYKASAEHDLFMTPEGNLVSDIPWRPSIHMPKEAARLFLRVKSVQIKGIQDITGDGIREEGLDFNTLDPIGSFNAFRKLWDSTMKPADCEKYGWNANPWVWVIKFERISKEDAMRNG